MRKLLFVILFAAKAYGQVQLWPPAWTFYGGAADPIPAFSDSIMWLEMANTNDPTEDSSAVGTNTGTLGAGAAKPTWTDLDTSFSTYYDFDGGDYITAANAAIGDFETNDSFSVACWFKTDSIAASFELFSKQNAADLKGWAVRGTTASQIRLMLVNDNSPANWLVVAANSAFSIGRWHHLVATYGGLNDPSSCAIYINGEPFGLTTISDTLTGSMDTANELETGRRADAANYLNGAMDDDIIYDVALTSDQVSELYWLQRPEHGGMQWDTDNRSDHSNTVAVYSFEADKTTDTSFDGANHLTDPGGGASPTWANDSGTNGWLDFDGGDYMTAPETSDTSPGTNDFSITFWMKIAVDGNTRYIWRDEGAGGTFDFCDFYIANNTNYVFSMRDAGTPVSAVANGAAFHEVWTHVAGVRSGTVLTLYTNGVFFVGKTNAALVDVDLTGGDAPVLGAVNTLGNLGTDGAIDEFRIYNGTALSSNTVYNLWNDTKGYHP